MGACVPMPLPLTLIDSTHILVLSEAWDLDETQDGAWKMVDISVFTVCSELQRLTIWLIIRRCLANLHA